MATQREQPRSNLSRFVSVSRQLGALRQRLMATSLSGDLRGRCNAFHREFLEGFRKTNKSIYINNLDLYVPGT